MRAVLIAGDLFDGARVRARTVDALLAAIRRTPEVDYLYLPGNHDEAANAFCDCALPGNLKLFGKTWSTVQYDGIAISGVQIGADAALYETLPHTDGAVNLVMLHGGIGTACAEDVINLKLLKNRGIDYLALGHIHSYQTGPLDETGSYCYPGCLEGRGFDECGEKGFVLLTVEDGSVAHEFVPFSARQLHRVPVDITGLTQNAQIAQRMKEQSLGLSPEDMVEFLLTGESDPTADISAPYLQQTLQGSFFFVKVKDESHLALDADAYRNDVSLKGEFIRQVLASELTDADKAAVIRARAAGAFGRGDFTMRLLRCHIENFGVLSGFDYEFPEGLAVICRENGFGKSTLAAFLKAMFYGLPRTGAHNVTENERRRFEPGRAENSAAFWNSSIRVLHTV